MPSVIPLKFPFERRLEVPLPCARHPTKTARRSLRKSPCVLFSRGNTGVPLTLRTIVANPLQCLHHDHRVAADDNHAELDLLAVILLLDSIVQNDIQENLGVKLVCRRLQNTERDSYIVSTEDANDLAAAIELDKQPLVEVLEAG
jgi:hypothetical protein